jgi:hypothetical protein
MPSESLARVRADFLRSVGRSSLRAVGLALLIGALTFVLGHQGAGFTITTGVAVAVLVAALSLIVTLIRTVASLDAQIRQQRRDIGVLNQKIGVHKAIAAWVSNCEQSLSDRGQGPPTEARLKQELDLLEANVINSVKNYEFYSPQLHDLVRSLAEGAPGDSVETRLNRLLVQLKRDLQAGSYLV